MEPHKILQSGIAIISGKNNTGKSTLLNILYDNARNVRNFNIVITSTAATSIDEIRERSINILPEYKGKDIVEYINQLVGKDLSYEDLKTCSSGTRAFGILKHLIETGRLTSKTVLLLDETDAHLHSTWQVEYARVLVWIRKQLKATICIVTKQSLTLQALKDISVVEHIEDEVCLYHKKTTPEGKRITLKTYKKTGRILHERNEAYELLDEYSDGISNIQDTDGYTLLSDATGDPVIK